MTKKARGWSMGLAVLILAGSATPPDAPVADAAMKGDIEAVRVLLKAGAEVNAPQGDGMTALHWAAETGNLQLANLLIFAGANLEAVTRVARYTPLLIAAEAAHGALVEALVEAGANVDARTVGGATALHVAGKAGDVASIAALVEGGADVDARESAWGQTPLMWAASLNRVEAVRALLKGGADPSLTTRVLEFTQAARTGRTGRQVRDSMFAAFRSKSANPSLWRPDPSEVQAALRAAREHDSVEPVEPGHIARIDWDSAQIAGRSPSASDEAGYQGGLTALLHAVREGNTEAAIALLEGGADVNQRGTGDLGTPLLRAMQNGHFDLGLELLRRGADPTLVNHPNEMTPLYAVINTQWASKSRYPQQQAYRQQKVTHLETMEALLEAGADPNARLALDYWFLGYNFGGVGVDFWGATPFFRAAHALDVPAMKLLVRYGADPNIPTKARANDRPGDLAEVTPAATDQSGLPPVQGGDPAMYPIHAAAGNAGGGAARADNFHTHVRDGWLPAVKYLVEELGADVGLRDSAGYGTIHGAAGRGHLEVVRYLLDKGADPFVLARSGVTAIDIANGPADGTVPFPEIIALLEGMGVVNNHVCVTVGSC